MGRWFAALLGLAAIVVVAAAFGARTGSVPAIRLGAPSDAAGLLAAVVAREAGPDRLALVGGVETFPVNDCCATVSQWAMSSESVDMALMCPDAAAALLEKDARFETAGPALYNAEVLVSRPGVRAVSAGVAQGRDRQAALIAQALGKDAVVDFMLPASLPYAYEKNVVDAVAVDFFTALLMRGDMASLAGADGDNLSYVLVVKKSLRDSPEFPRIIEAFRAAANMLDAPDGLRRAALEHKNISLSENEVRLWRKMRIRFVSPTNTPTGSPGS